MIPRAESTGILNHLKASDRKALRRCLISAIVSTDMTSRNELLLRANRYAASNAGDAIAHPLNVKHDTFDDRAFLARSPCDFSKCTQTARHKHAHAFGATVGDEFCVRLPQVSLMLNAADHNTAILEPLYAQRIARYQRQEFEEQARAPGCPCRADSLSQRIVPDGTEWHEGGPSGAASRISRRALWWSDCTPAASQGGIRARPAPVSADHILLGLPARSQAELERARGQPVTVLLAGTPKSRAEQACFSAQLWWLRLTCSLALVSDQIADCP